LPDYRDDAQSVLGEAIAELCFWGSVGQLCVHHAPCPVVIMCDKQQ